MQAPQPTKYEAKYIVFIKKLNNWQSFHNSSWSGKKKKRELNFLTLQCIVWKTVSSTTVLKLALTISAPSSWSTRIVSLNMNWQSNPVIKMTSKAEPFWWISICGDLNPIIVIPLFVLEFGFSSIPTIRLSFFSFILSKFVCSFFIWFVASSSWSGNDVSCKLHHLLAMHMFLVCARARENSTKKKNHACFWRFLNAGNHSINLKTSFSDVSEGPSFRVSEIGFCRLKICIYVYIYIYSSREIKRKRDPWGLMGYKRIELGIKGFHMISPVSFYGFTVTSWWTRVALLHQKMKNNRTEQTTLVFKVLESLLSARRAGSQRWKQNIIIICSWKKFPELRGWWGLDMAVFLGPMRPSLTD